MNFTTKLLSMLSIALLIGSAAPAQDRYSRVRIPLDQGENVLHSLSALGIAVDHGERRKDLWIETDLSDLEISIARNAGFEVKILIEDVSQFYRDRNNAAPIASPKVDREFCNAPMDYPLPQNFSLGSMGGFFTWPEMLDQLDAMRTAYPDLISEKAPIGNSHEERPIHFVRISNSPDTDQDKPEVLYDALHHAREPASLHQLITFMWYLLENYGTDAEVTYIVDNLELYFVPCVNPDGYVFNELNEPDGGGMWRKNRRNNGDGTFGVDLNRNYGLGWGFDNDGSSPNPMSEIYRGPSAFSEPETQAMRDFCNDHAFRIALNYHTYGDLLVYPWSYQPSFYTPDSAVFVNYSDLLTNDNRYRFGTADQTVNYVTNGDSDDWMYGEQDTKPKIFAMTPEAGREGEGFWPPIAQIPTICMENIWQNLRTAHLTGKFALSFDRSGPIIGDLDAHAAFMIQRLGTEPGTLTISIEPIANVLSAGDPIVMDNMALLEERTDSIGISLDPSLTEGDEFSYAIAIDNGAFIYRDTITKIFGTPMIAFADNGNDLSSWQNFGWDVTMEDAFSGPSSITDSEFGDYPDNANIRMTLLQPIDLTNAAAAVLNFHGKWDIEARYHHVQFLASTDGSNWNPLCGQHTRPGAPFQGEGDPVYDGQQPDWIREEIRLDDYLGAPMHLRIRLSSDQGVNYDGFYWDDLIITTTGTGPSAIVEDHVQLFHAGPNPANESTWITFDLPSSAQDAQFQLFDQVGALVRSIDLASDRGSFQLHTADLAAGLYSFSIRLADRSMPAQKLIVVH